MVADSCLTEGKAPENTLYVGSVDKIFRLRDGSLIGLSGDAEGTEIVQIFDDNLDDPLAVLAGLTTVTCECRGLVVRPDGRMFWLATNDPGDEETSGYAEYMQFRDDFAAVGTGAWIAYGAMEGRKDVSAREAIEAACRRHPYTRPPILEMSLDG